MTGDPFFDDADDEPNKWQASATLQLAVEHARILQDFALKWVCGARTKHAMEVRRVAWDIACGSRRDVSEAAKQLGCSRQQLHRVVANCKRYRASYAL